MSANVFGAGLGEDAEEWHLQGAVAWKQASIVLVRSNDGVVEWIAPAVAEILGYEPADVVGCSLLDFTHTDEHQAVLASRVALAATGRAAHRGRLRHRDGSWRWIDVQAQLARRDDGRRTRAVSAWRDVTREVQLVEALEENQRTFRLIAENASDVVVRGTTLGELDWVSPSVTAMTGWSPEDLAGRHFVSLVHADDVPTVTAAQADLAAGRTAQFEARVATAAGGYVWVSVTVREVDEPGRGRFRVAAWRNIQRKVEAREALAASSRMFRLLAENGSDVVLLVDAGGIITWASPSVTSAIGWVPDALVGSPLAGLVHGVDSAVLQPRTTADAHVEQGEREVLLARVSTAAGPTVWMSGTAAPVTDPVTGDPVTVVALHDVTDRVAAQDAMVRDRARLQATLSSLLDPHVLLVAVRDEDGAIVDFEYGDANEAACNYVSMTRDEMVGSRLLDLLPGQAAGMIDLYAEAVNSGDPLVLDDYAYPNEIIGAERRYDIRGVRIGDALSFTWRDVTDRYETALALAASEARFRLLAENVSDVVMHIRDGIIAWVSPSVVTAFGREPDEMIGHPSDAFVHPDDVDLLLAKRKILTDGGTVVFRVRGVAKNGDHHWIELHGAPFIDTTGHQDGNIVSWRIVDDQVANERELSRRAHHDELSGLLNRREALDRLSTLMTRAPGGRNPVVMFCDLDHFKTINDTFGHQTGDELIRVIAQRLRDEVRPDDIVARLGGDEFLVILTDIPDAPTSVAVANKLRHAIAEPLTVDGHHLEPTASIGLAIARTDENVTDLLARADHAMYKAKRAGRNRVSTDDA